MGKDEHQASMLSSRTVDSKLFNTVNTVSLFLDHCSEKKQVQDPRLEHSADGQAWYHVALVPTSEQQAGIWQ